MKNIEKYKGKLTDILDNLAVLKNGKPEYCASIECNNCIFSNGPFEKCMNYEKVNWLLEEYKEPKLDPTTLKVDDLILVSMYDGVHYVPRYFAKFTKGVLYCFEDGTTSITNTGGLTAWNYYKKYEEENKMKVYRKKRKLRTWVIVVLSLLLTISLLLLADTMKTCKKGSFKKEVDMVNKLDRGIEPLSKLIEVDLPYKNVDLSTKTYMDFKKITSRTSPQWDYLYESGNIFIDSRGFLVTAEDYIGVAMGSFFGDIGTKYHITLEGHEEPLKVVIVERKADVHTDIYNFMAGSNDVIEFVIDTSNPYMQDNVWSNGFIFQGNFNNSPEFEGNIVKIERVLE